MPFVYIYAGNGRFAGSEFQWNCPPLASQHDIMLFLRQDIDMAARHAALAEIDRYGFKQVKLMADGRKIVVESMNDPKLAGFQQHYEEALAIGSSLVWYP
jgi:hypothetical protein